MHEPLDVARELEHAAVVGANALEHAVAVEQAVVEDVHRGFGGGPEGAVEIDHSIQSNWSRLDWFWRVCGRCHGCHNAQGAPMEKNQSVNGFFRAIGVEPGGVPRQRPMYRVLVDLVERGLAHGAFGPGDQLPPERDLARAIRISRATVVRAYGELESRGLVRGYVGRGTFVSASPDAGAAPFAWRGQVARAALQASDSTVRDLMRLVADPNVLSFAAGQPALDVFPTQAFQQSIMRAVGRDASIWRNGPTEGLHRCR